LLLQNDSDYANALIQARRQARVLRAFYTHLIAYLGVMVLLVFINVSTGDAMNGNWWIQWPALGWGVGIALHALTTLSGGALFGAEWEERKVTELLTRRHLQK
jgi:low temperature requirement protein LtrA